MEQPFHLAAIQCRAVTLGIDADGAQAQVLVESDRVLEITARAGLAGRWKPQRNWLSLLPRRL